MYSHLNLGLINMSCLQLDLVTLFLPSCALFPKMHITKIK